MIFLAAMFLIGYKQIKYSSVGKALPILIAVAYRHLLIFSL